MAVMSCVWAAAKVAVTLAFCPLVGESWQEVPLQAPLKPEKVQPEAGDAVSVTPVPELKLAAQVPGQLMPAGELVTVPVPETVTDTWAGGPDAKVAETAWFAESTSRQEVPVQAPPNPVKLKPEAACAASVTAVPEGKLAVQLPGQLIPAGLLLTVPFPLMETASCA
jgi:hypothetical protein